MVEPADWRHVTKVDPDKGMSEEKMRDIAVSGTDAVVVGGTQGVTREKVLSLLSSVDADVPVVVEPSNPASAVGAGDALLVPTVLNADTVDWVVGIHKEWARTEDVDWSRVVGEGYIVMNPDSAVGRLTGADTSLSPQEAAGYAEVADGLFDLPVVYVEYSGTFGDTEVIEAVADAVDDATVFYGGGVDGYDRAKEAARYADCIVVGDAVHEKGVDALRETVRGVDDARGV
ncbi:heptaprenylglyceryl phosphate synthase [Haladaptatus sp. F3-133]|jgi:phosphoglycerol geranylgeranyltransferase|uniref:Geranylgeranylglyceryl phosphate synthase n=1 Tax=Halorutilus salinus TaxID=2487751 RepID=A0A9Q4C3Z9_9EURY|nr:heptaprenylglyceryl phosphate synthase [Halorutilus salinus]MCX2817921.1 heptaprenylglyceryl phosphate synthase [Halorutilus salinus]